MSSPEVLGDGPERDTAAPFEAQVRRAAAAARRRRLVGIAGTVVLAGAAALLAGRSAPEPRPPQPAATAPVAPTPAVPAPALTLVDIAVGTRWAYVLVGSCAGPEQARECSYRLLRRDIAGGGWSARPLRTRLLAAAGFTARLFVSGDDLVTVVDEPVTGQVYASLDGGDSVAVRPVRPGPPVPDLAAGAVLDLALCESCGRRLTVLEPLTGRLRPMATQPPLGPGVEIRSVSEDGGAIWVVGTAGSTVRTAVSIDRGRSWRVLPVGGLRGPVGVARIVGSADGGAYLLVGRDDRPDVLNDFSELWRIEDLARSGTAWRQVTPSFRPRSALSVVAGARGLLVGEESGEVWRLLPDGSMRRLPDAVVDSVPVPPGYLVTGKSRLLVAVPLASPGRTVLLVSSDEGETWRAEDVRG